MNKLWYRENRDRCLALAKDWKARNREKVLEQKKRWYKKHRLAILKSQRDAYAENPTNRIATSSKWYRRNKQKKAEYDRLRILNRTEEQKEKDRRRSRDYARRHPDRAHAWQKSNPELATACKLKWARNNSGKIKAWANAHPELVKAYKLKYHRKNPQAARKWALENPDLNRELKRLWGQRNPGKISEYSNRRRARKAKATVGDTAMLFYAFVRSRERIRCYYCGDWVSGQKAHIDHVIALAKEGNHASENLCASCQKCNLKKGVKLPSEIHFIDQGLLNL